MSVSVPVVIPWTTTPFVCSKFPIIHHQWITPLSSVMEELSPHLPASIMSPLLPPPPQNSLSCFNIS